MNDLNWHEALPVTHEELYSRFPHGDLLFSGLILHSPLDGALHISGFQPAPNERADLFILFKEIHKITQLGIVTNPVFRYNVETIDAEGLIKRLTLQFDNGRTEIEFRDDLLYLCKLSNGEMRTI